MHAQYIHFKFHTMKKTVFLLGIILLFVLPSPGSYCHAQTQTIKASASYVTREIKNLASFTAIRVSGRPDVEYRQSKDGKTSVYVYAPTNLIDLVETVSRNNTLYIKIKDRVKITGKTKIKVIVSTPQLYNAEVVGSGDISFLGTLTSEKLQLSINGSGDISGENLQSPVVGISIQGSGDVDLRRINCNTISVNINGSGDVSMVGGAQKGTFSIKGSGDITANRFAVQDLKVSVAGSGDVICYPIQRLEAQVAGSGDISYVGSPKQVSLGGNKNHIKKVK